MELQTFVETDKYWYREFFSGIPLECWSKIASPEMTGQEAEFIKRMLRLEKNERILDVPCGNGRHASILAGQGFKVTGVDIANSFIKQALPSFSAKAAANFEYMHMEMQSLTFNNEFDGGYCLGNSFGYLDHEDTCNFVAAIGRALKSGAHFILETGMAAEALLPNLEEQTWFDLDNTFMLIKNSYDPANSCLLTEYTFLHNNKKETRLSRHNVYTAGEIRRLFEAEQMTTTGMYGSTEQDPFEFGAPRLLLVVEKN